MKRITDNIYYVGVNDRNKTLFEGLWPLPYGVSYNAYLIDDEKVCLVDTVEADFFMPFLENIREVIGERPIDYVVVNHMEPDHSGSLALLRQFYPGIQIIGNKKTFDMLSGFYRLTDGLCEVKNGDKLSLGATELQGRGHATGGIAARAGLQQGKEIRHTPRREDDVSVFSCINRSLPVRIGRKVGLPPLGARGWFPRKGAKRKYENKRWNNQAFHI
jgi:glyoxylase-like metal-dependent hydrolase (beta-lactamase superfamily II)